MDVSNVNTHKAPGLALRCRYCSGSGGSGTACGECGGCGLDQDVCTEWRWGFCTELRRYYLQAPGQSVDEELLLDAPAGNEAGLMVEGILERICCAGNSGALFGSAGMAGRVPLAASGDYSQPGERI